MQRKTILLTFLPIPLFSACAGPSNEGDEVIEAQSAQIDDLNQRISRLESEVERIEADTESPSGEAQLTPQAPVRRASFVLLIDGQRAAVYSDRARCEAAALELQSQADQEQARRDELNRIEQEKPGPPGVIYGPAKRPETKCLAGD